MPAPSIILQQNRREPRYGVLAEVEIAGAPQEVHYEGLVNISESGMFIPLNPSDSDEFRDVHSATVKWKFVQALHAHSFSADCLVKRSTPYGIALKFEEMDSESKSRLRELVRFLSRQREELWPGVTLRSILDTIAACVSAMGVGCGLVGLMIIKLHPSWARFLIVAMIVSIFLYALIRFARGPWPWPFRFRQTLHW